MSQQLRRTIIVELFGEEVPIDVDFRLIEVIERAFERSAEHAIALFVQAGGVQRRRVADIVADSLLRKGACKWSRNEIREAVIMTDIQTFTRNVAALEAALLFSLKLIDDETFDVSKSDIADSRKKKQPAPSTASSPPATA